LEEPLAEEHRQLVTHNETRTSLIALDLDGTIMGKDRVISRRLRHAFKRATDRGYLVTIATGRGFAPTARYAKDLGVNAPIICYQGALIQDYRDGRAVHSATIPLEAARELVAFSQARQLNFQVYTQDDRAYVGRMDPVAAKIAELAGIPVTAVEDLAGWLSQPPIKFLFLEQEDAVADLVRDMQVHFDGQLQVVRSWDRLIEATGLGASKGDALARLAAHLGISQSRTMAVGDQDNDVSMIAWAGRGVAMGNASPEAKAVADVIAPSVEADGAAWAIERYVLGEGDSGDESNEDLGYSR
jgi:Cof subfamily protein (haloacid dehalogenase superfamily)